MYIKKASWTIHMEGEDADGINLVEIIDKLELKVKVTCGHVNVNYTPEEKPKSDTPKK